jgi:hypothetical protein
VTRRWRIMLECRCDGAFSWCGPYVVEAPTQAMATDLARASAAVELHTSRIETRDVKAIELTPRVAGAARPDRARDDD